MLRASQDILAKPSENIQNVKTINFYVLCYEQTSPLDVPMYAFGQGNQGWRLDFPRFVRSSSFFPIPQNSPQDYFLHGKTLSGFESLYAFLL